VFSHMRDVRTLTRESPSLIIRPTVLIGVRSDQLRLHILIRSDFQQASTKRPSCRVTFAPNRLLDLIKPNQSL